MITSSATYTDSTVSDYFTLLKPGVMSLVVFTGACGMWLAPVHIHPFMQLLAIACIALGSGAGAAINMWYDRDIDAVMRRTGKRPLPAGRIAPENALALGVFLSALSVMLMELAVGVVAAGLLAFAIFFYSVIYTMWLKRSTPQNIVIGGAAGAFPPMIGWAAATGNISYESIWLFSLIFLWTPPHFWALAIYRNEDYRRANVPMLPVTAGIDATKRQMLAYTILLVLVSVVPAYAFGFNLLYLAGAACLGAGFLFHAIRVLKSNEPGHAMRMFGFSIMYLFALFALMVADHILIGRG